MADDQQQADKSVEEQAQQPAVPTDTKQVTELAGSQEAAQETGETSGEPAGGSDKTELPQTEVSDRTREQFDKLTANNRQLKQELDQTKAREAESSTEATPLYDKNTGLVNLQALEAVQKDATDAKREIASLRERQSRDSQDSAARELYDAHPELEKQSTKESKELFDESERIWLHSQYNPDKYGGRPLSQKQSADLAKKKMGTVKETPEQEAQRGEAKEQASLSASGQPSQGVQSKITSEEEAQRQQLGTRLGDKDMMIARMRAIRESSGAKK